MKSILPLSSYPYHLIASMCYRYAVLLAASILWLQALTSHAQFFIPELQIFNSAGGPLLLPLAACGQACFEQAVNGLYLDIPRQCASGDLTCLCRQFDAHGNEPDHITFEMLAVCVSEHGVPGCTGPIFDGQSEGGLDEILFRTLDAVDRLCAGTEFGVAAPLFLSSSMPTNTSKAAAPASRKLLQSLPKFGDVSMAFHPDYVAFNVTLTNLDVLHRAVPYFGDVTISHMHVQGGNSSTHLAYFVDAAEGDSIKLPRSGDYQLASGELSFDEFDVPDTNMSLTEYVLEHLPDIFADIHTTSCQPPCEALRGSFTTE